MPNKKNAPKVEMCLPYNGGGTLMLRTLTDEEVSRIEFDEAEGTFKLKPV